MKVQLRAIAVEFDFVQPSTGPRRRSIKAARQNTRGQNRRSKSLN
jgi:hypothetical protein